MSRFNKLRDAKIAALQTVIVSDRRLYRKSNDLNRRSPLYGPLPAPWMTRVFLVEIAGLFAANSESVVSQVLIVQ
jgi:hypothetical protein